MPTIAAIGCRRVLNSHVAFTTEFVMRLDDGTVGYGASPEGETISIYEDRKSTDPNAVIERLQDEGIVGRPVDQADLDDYLSLRIGTFGRNTCYALSLAFYDAVSRAAWSPMEPFQPSGSLSLPKICCNVLNGGWHAYTNPVLSDFSEYLLVAKDSDIDRVIAHHDEIQHAVSAALVSQPKVVVSGNPVSRFSTADNRECIEFLLGISERLGLAGDFDLMIDASAGDLRSEEGYQLSLTEDTRRSSGQFRDYWLGLIKDYPLRFLEDPFAEQDRASWSYVAESQQECLLIGDNLYCSDADKIAQGAADGCTGGVIVKPNQAGTITAVSKSFETAKRDGQIVIASHRSISTESTLEAKLACQFGADYIKVGPLMTDYSSVMRVNEMIRLAG